MLIKITVCRQKYIADIIKKTKENTEVVIFLSLQLTTLIAIVSKVLLDSNPASALLP